MFPNRCVLSYHTVVSNLGFQVPTFEFAEILIEWLNSTLCIEYGPVNHERGTSPPDDVPRNNLVSPWILNLAIVVFFWEHKRLHLVISQFAGVDVDDEVFF